MQATWKAHSKHNWKMGEVMKGTFANGEEQPMSILHQQNHPCFSMSDVMTKLEYYIANVNPECWSKYTERMLIDHIQPYLITNTGSYARRALTLLCTRSRKLGIKVASWYPNVTNLKACKVCNEGMIEEECKVLLFTCSTYSAICSIYESDIFKRK